MNITLIKKYVKICQDEGFKHRFGTSEHLELFISKSQNPKRRNKTLLQKGNFPISENSANLRHFSHSNSPRCCRAEHPAPTAAGHSAPTHPGTAANDQRIPRSSERNSSWWHRLQHSRLEGSSRSPEKWGFTMIYHENFGINMDLQ